MGKSKLKVTHPDVTYESLNEYSTHQCPEEVGLRIAILRGVMEKMPIDKLSRKRNMSRQGIYNLVKRVNSEGIRGLESKRPGRPCKLTAEIAGDLKEILLLSPMRLGYGQFRWDNILVRKYLKDIHNVEIGRSQLLNWLRIIGSPVELVRKKYKKAEPGKHKVFAADLKIQKEQNDETAPFSGEAVAKLDPSLVVPWLPRGGRGESFLPSAWNRYNLQEKVNILINHF